MCYHESEPHSLWRTTAVATALAAVLAGCTALETSGSGTIEHTKLTESQATEVHNWARLGYVGLEEYRINLGRKPLPIPVGATPLERLRIQLLNRMSNITDQFGAHLEGPDHQSPWQPTPLGQSLSGGDVVTSYTLTPDHTATAATIVVKSDQENLAGSYKETATFTNPNVDFFHDATASPSEIMAYFADSHTTLQAYDQDQKSDVDGSCALHAQFFTPDNVVFDASGSCTTYSTPRDAAGFVQAMAERVEA